MKLIKHTMILAGVLAACTTHAEDAPAQTITVDAAAVQAATSAPAVQAKQEKAATVIVSPRTGMRYVVNNPENRPVVFKTEVIAPATSQNADRIVASNPALSTQSQEKAKAALLELAQPQQQDTTEAAVSEPVNNETVTQ